MRKSQYYSKMRKLFLFGLTFLFCQILILPSSSKNSVNYYKVLYSKKLYRTLLYLEYYQVKSDVIYTLKSRVSGTKFYLNLKEFKKGQLVFDENYELLPFRYYEFIKKIDYYFFHEKFTSTKPGELTKDDFKKVESVIQNDPDVQFTPWIEKYNSTKDKTSYTKPNLKKNYFHANLEYFDKADILVRSFKKTFLLNTKTMRNKLKYTIDFFNEYSIPRSKK